MAIEMYSTKSARANRAMTDMAAVGVSVGRSGVLAVNEVGGRLSLMPLDYGQPLDAAVAQVIRAFNVEVREGDKPMFSINQWLNAKY